jgi:hypothetical protein
MWGHKMPDATPRKLAHAPEDLLHGRLRRLGEGIGKVVYASQHWVVARERSPGEIAALIVLWKLLKLLPGKLGARMLSKPSRKIRFLHLLTQAAIAIVPKSVWYTPHVREVWTVYHRRNLRGERLAQAHLFGTPLVPERVTFPPTRVKIAGWPGSLTVSEATERVEATLFERLSELARAGRYDEVERWLERFLDLRPKAWKLGLFSVDAHLKNFGVTGDRIILLDTGGLTNRWREVEERLDFEEVFGQPHIQLGLGPILGSQPEIASRFDARWKALVNREVISEHWPARPA